MIVSFDVTRPTKDDVIVPALLNELDNANAPDERIKVVIGRGQHREMTREEVAKSIINEGDTIIMPSPCYEGVNAKDFC